VIVAKGLGDLVMDKQTQYISKIIQATKTENRVLIYRDSDSEELVVSREVFDDLFMPVGDLTDQIDKEFETYTRRLLSESKPYSDMTNKELRAESVQAVVLLLGEQKADEQ